MGTLFSGVGLASGMDIQSIVDRLIALDARPRDMLRSRVSNLDAQRTAYLDISARITAMLARVTALSTRSGFATVAATSSNSTALSASASEFAAPGSYSFLVKSLATTQQLVSRGFTSTTSAVGSGTITIESARARVNTQTRLDELNGYAGVQRGSFELIDAAGTSKTISVADAFTLADVVTRINSAGLNVQAAVRGDHLELTETTGGTVQVREVSDGRTAADLGFGPGRMYSTTGRIDGSDLITLSTSTPVTSLNDGVGLRGARAGGDFTINGMTVDLSGLMTPGTRLARLNHGAGVNLGRIKITTYNADNRPVAREIDLSAARTIGDVKSTLEAAGANVSVTITGEKLIINNTVTTAHKRIVIEDVTGHAARDLGILGDTDNRITGTRALFNDTMADVLAAINHADTSDGTISASLNGTSLVINGGAGTTLAALGDSRALADLGFSAGAFSGTAQGSRVLGGVDTVLLRSLNGGRGIDPGVVTITVGDQSVQADLTGSTTLAETLERANDAIRTAGLTAQLSYDSTGTRIVARSFDGLTPVSVTDQTGAFASTLGLTEAGASVRGANLQRQWISESTALKSLNSGRGIGSGVIKITNSRGIFEEVDLSSAKTMGDVIRAVNSADIGVTARINDTGDGLLLTDTAAGPDAMTVAEESGTAARDLNILGEAQSGAIDGSFELKLDLSAGATLQDVVNRINAASGSPVSASILNDGTGVSPYRLQLTAENSGSLGEVVLDTGTTGVDFSTLSRAQDARIVLGGGEGGIMVVSATNTITNVVPGLSLTLTETSDQPVTVTVSRDYAAAKTAIDGLVTAFNDAIDRIRQASGYNAETEERGILLGDATIKNVESRLLRTMTGSIPGGLGAVKRWAQLGIKLAEGQLQFDQARFDEAFAADPQAVIDAFTRPETGIAASLKKTLEGISDSSDGVIARRNNALETQKDDLNDRIASLNELLDRKRQRLMRQFLAMESAISQLQSQGSALSQIGSLNIPSSSR